MSNLAYAELDRLRDRIVVVIKIEALADVRFATAERRMMALAEGGTAGTEELRALERTIAVTFLEGYREILRACPDRQELEAMPQMMTEEDRFVMSFTKKVEKLGLLPAIARAAAGSHRDARVSVTRTWELRFPALGGHEHAIESADMGFDELDACHKLAGDCAVWAELAVKKRRAELLQIAQTLTSLYATRIDGDGDHVSLCRLGDGAPVSRDDLERRARQLLA